MPASGDRPVSPMSQIQLSPRSPMNSIYCPMCNSERSDEEIESNTCSNCFGSAIAISKWTCKKCGKRNFAGTENCMSIQCTEKPPTNKIKKIILFGSYTE